MCENHGGGERAGCTETYAKRGVRSTEYYIRQTDTFADRVLALVLVLTYIIVSKTHVDIYNLRAVRHNETLTLLSGVGLPDLSTLS